MMTNFYFSSPNFQIDNIVKNKKKSSQKWQFRKKVYIQKRIFDWKHDLRDSEQLSFIIIIIFIIIVIIIIFVVVVVVVYLFHCIPSFIVPIFLKFSHFLFSKYLYFTFFHFLFFFLIFSNFTFCILPILPILLTFSHSFPLSHILYKTPPILSFHSSFHLTLQLSIFGFTSTSFPPLHLPVFLTAVPVLYSSCSKYFRC